MKMNENPYKDINSAKEESKKERVLEGDLMRKSAQNLPSIGSIKFDGNGRESQFSQINRSLKGDESILSLFAHIPDHVRGNSLAGQPATKSNNMLKNSRRSQSSLSCFSRDFADIYMPGNGRSSVYLSEDGEGEE